MKKDSVQDTFKRNLSFVKPLYRKVKYGERDKDTRSVSFDRTLKLLGDDINVKVLASDKGNVVNIKRKVSREYNIVLPGACDSEIKFDGASKDLVQPKQLLDRNIISVQNKPYSENIKRLRTKMLDTVNGAEINEMAEFKKTIILHTMPDTWMRVYPAPRLTGEPVCSVVVRCAVCQLGLTTFLVLWTIIGVFIIHSFEGPQEEKVARDFSKAQNQLIIDLATELRQITPVSPKWKEAIEKRIEEERRLTMMAVGRGARINAGHFWDLPGTFLFAVYVMTALGFGAPVPVTVWGRTSALIYAVLAVPIHIYLMVNASTCVVVHVDGYTKRLKAKFDEDTKKPNATARENPTHSRNSQFLEPSNDWKFRRGLRRIPLVFLFGGFVPLATVLYYVLGVVSFGVLRGRTALETLLFPLEFTTTGGLECIQSHVRIIYGFYVEGAMCLLACALATLKRHSRAALAGVSGSYRLFSTEQCDQCPATPEHASAGKI